MSIKKGGLVFSYCGTCGKFEPKYTPAEWRFLSDSQRREKYCMCDREVSKPKLFPHLSGSARWNAIKSLRRKQARDAREAQDPKGPGFCPYCFMKIGGDYHQKFPCAKWKEAQDMLKVQ